ncbi:TraR/DksA C4-type zinc finger protein [Magnetospirillum aberrantis]|uniref:TraR/DksA family transcriptional regulator n=1 Tax=Magnetospirillum aberrantis SpK TaxID=908842 RepID=A0A7C9QTP5_9PROT|nr:TraR/DksA C4-type zinc finger protein [Magnetospirillum aberrantis]NFV80057.1 TraR/DksA family transcriptional regulator [Magnetospirillum aberrantis SpK]
MDDIDNAAERIAAFNAQALAAMLDRPQAPPSDGICKACGEDIEPERLAVQPNARHCAECCMDLEEDAARRRRRGW